MDSTKVLGKCKPEIFRLSNESRLTVHSALAKHMFIESPEEFKEYINTNFVHEFKGGDEGNSTWFVPKSRI